MTPVFARLVGLETEYAVRFDSRRGGRPSDYALYRALVEALRQKLPSAAADPANQDKPGLFLANGGAVWFERSRFTDQVGLIEGSTPECRGPRQLLCCQQAQDRLLSETARHAGPGFCLVKNCRDSQGETYGAQENYSVHLASGWRLRVWRVAWVPLYVLLVLQCAFLLAFSLLVLVLNLLVAGLLYWLLCKFVNPDDARRERWRINLFGAQWVTQDPIDPPWPDWLEAPLFVLMKLTVAPFFVLVSWLVGVTDLRRTQQRLVAFLASRAVLGGSGWLGPDGRFYLTEKAQTRRTLWTEVIPDQTRPVFSPAHFCKMAGPFRARWKELLAPRQRMQICLGDSNLCQEAEYLRVATTLLVIDAIEAGAITAPPRLRRPLHAMRQISRDTSLSQQVELCGGGRMTALEIQRWYLDACRHFVEGVADAPQEAHEVLRLWADVLDRLESDRASLVGRLDWVTKQFLLDKVGADLDHAARKKIDLRYHELSPEGYFARLRSAGLVEEMLSEAEVEQATRLPPASSPAWKRARYIREFSGGGALLSVGWRFLTVRGEGGQKTTVDLHDAAQ
jgi:proteasome accessory factor A